MAPTGSAGDALAQGDHGKVVQLERAPAVTVTVEVVTEVDGVECDGGVHGRPPGRHDRFQVPPQSLPVHGRYVLVALGHGRGQQGVFAVRAGYFGHDMACP